MTDATPDFLSYSARLLGSELLPRIRGCMEQLSEEDIWWRPNEASNSIGNLVLHLSGNVRQWIVSGVGGEPDVRTRQLEFDQRASIPKAELLSTIVQTVRDARTVLESLDPAVLTEERTIQGQTVTVMQAVYHVVEHFSMHTGQIAYITKLRLGKDLGFYMVVDGIARSQWHAEP